MRRFLPFVAVAAALAFTAPAHAKPFTYTDPADMPANAGLDIVGVTYGTEGTTTVQKVRGKKVTTYTPAKLVVTMKLAGAPLNQAGVRYLADAEVSECGPMTFTYTPGVALPPSALSVGCGGAGGVAGSDTTFLDPKISVKGSSITWTISLKALPKVARAGALLYNLRSAVDVVDPALGALGPSDFDRAVFDTATSDADWEIG